MRMMRTIYYNLGKIFQIAKRDGVTTAEAAERMAQERINTIGRVRRPFMGNQPPRFLGRMRNG
jgi:leucine dehydrogenase